MKIYWDGTRLVVDDEVNSIMKHSPSLGLLYWNTNESLQRTVSIKTAVGMLFENVVFSTVTDSGGDPYDTEADFELELVGFFVNASVLGGTSDVVLSTVLVENTAVETEIWSVTVGANSMTAGKVFTFHANGLLNSSGVLDSVTIRIKVGGITRSTMVGLAKKSIDADWHIDSYATQRTIGVTGSRASHIHMHMDGVDSDDIIIGAVDTTTNIDVAITAQWNNADVGNVFELHQAYLETKN